MLVGYVVCKRGKSEGGVDSECSISVKRSHFDKPSRKQYVFNTLVATAAFIHNKCADSTETTLGMSL